MREFCDIDDVEEWLEPLDYETFWYEVLPFELTLQDRHHCDHQIRVGGISQDLVLDVLKGMARLELTQKLRLGHRTYVEEMALH
ncbi:MAG: hypothetical protein ACSHYC_05765 [Alphaproteobacteria bacterium]